MLPSFLLLLLQDHSERDEGVPTRRPHRPLQDDQTREGQTQRTQPAEVPQLPPAPPTVVRVFPKFIIFVYKNYGAMLQRAPPSKPFISRRDCRELR